MVVDRTTRVPSPPWLHPPVHTSTGCRSRSEGRLSEARKVTTSFASVGDTGGAAWVLKDEDVIRRAARMMIVSVKDCPERWRIAFMEWA
jgi:hypothetical protein